MARHRTFGGMRAVAAFRGVAAVGMESGVAFVLMPRGVAQDGQPRGYFYVTNICFQKVLVNNALFTGVYVKSCNAVLMKDDATLMHSRYCSACTTLLTVIES